MNHKKYKIIIYLLIGIILMGGAFTIWQVFNWKVEYEERILFWEIKHAKVMYETNWIPLWEYEKEK